jgi:hypothetical protein
MTNRIWNGSSWKEYKNLKVFNGAWKDAAKGWVNTSTGWRQWYPEYPVLITSPTITGSNIQMEPGEAFLATKHFHTQLQPING